MRISRMWFQVAAGVMAVAAFNGVAEDIMGFTALEAKNRCEFQTPEGAFQAVQPGKFYIFGTTVRTGRNSSMLLEFSTGNTFQLLARTTLQITQDVRNPKLKVLKLQQGTVTLKLDKFPSDHKLQVETPTAVCGAVGTRFVVSFEDADLGGKTRENRFECDKGEVHIASRFTVGNAPITGKSFDVPSVPAGSALVAVVHEGEENTYSDITVNRGRLTFDYGGGDGGRFTVAPEENHSARFVCSLEKSASDTDLVAMQVKSGKVISEQPRRFLMKPKVEVIEAADGAVLVREREVYTEPEKVTVVSDYLAAAKAEGELHTELVQLREQGGPATDIAAKEVAVKVAATKATALRNQLSSKRMRTMLRQLRAATRRTQMHRIRRP